MWLVLNDAFLSIVAVPKDAGLLSVRARARDDIKRVFPRARVHATPHRDYPFRAFVTRGVVAKAVAARVSEIEYGNFKDSVPQAARHDAYLDVWRVMQDWSRGRYDQRDGLPPWVDNYTEAAR